MNVPTLSGIIDRRILINYSVDKDVITKILPSQFKPKLVKGRAIVGICLIRLKNVRPKGLPGAIGISSENAAHRIAVEWNEGSLKKEGVYIPRRDTSSTLNALAGGCIFPGEHHLSDFSIEEGNTQYSISFKHKDGTYVTIEGQETTQWPADSILDTFEKASDFFQKGSVGYSPDKIGETYDGLELKTSKWEMFPLHVTHVDSSFFNNKKIFPEQSIRFENALLMKNIEHEWKSLNEIKKSDD
jgi:hypothetical protein